MASEIIHVLATLSIFCNKVNIFVDYCVDTELNLQHSSGSMFEHLISTPLGCLWVGNQMSHHLARTSFEGLQAFKTVLMVFRMVIYFLTALTYLVCLPITQTFQNSS